MRIQSQRTTLEVNNETQGKLEISHQIKCKAQFLDKSNRSVLGQTKSQTQLEHTHTHTHTYTHTHTQDEAHVSIVRQRSSTQREQAQQKTTVRHGIIPVTLAWSVLPRPKPQLAPSLLNQKNIRLQSLKHAKNEQSLQRKQKPACCYKSRTKKKRHKECNMKSTRSSRVGSAHTNVSGMCTAFLLPGNR